MPLAYYQIFPIFGNSFATFASFSLRTIGRAVPQSRFYDLGMLPALLAAEQQAARGQPALLIRITAVAKPARGTGFGPNSQRDQAACTESRNLPTSSLRRLESPDSDCAAASTCEDAEPVSLAPRCTSPMLEDTCWVPIDACCTLREISCVAAPCSSTAAAMVEEISDSFSMVPLISLIAFTESWVAAWMPVICWPISPVALEVCSASAFTSEATTAKPRPASPARAASMVALSANRLVWPAMVLMSSTTSPMRAAAFDNSLTRPLV